MTAPQQTTDPFALLRTRQYASLLVLAAVLGVPVAFGAYFFLALVSKVQGWIYTDLPEGLGLGAEPAWWPLPALGLAGILVATSIRYLPGRGGHSPAAGFHAAGPPGALELPGIFAAALASLGLGAVVGPEAPLIAMGGGLAALAITAVKRDSTEETVAVVGASGSFAAVSALLGSPLTAAFLMMETAGLGGAKATLVLVPGLLAAGIGFLVFIGLDSWTGLGRFSLAIPGLAPFGVPTMGEFGWAIVIGLGAAVLGSMIRAGAVSLRPRVEGRLLFTAAVGVGVAVLAILYRQVTGHGYADVLFSGQNSLPSLVQHSGDYSVEALCLLIACKSLAYSGSLSGFRGGPIFPAIFIGAAGGIALSHLPGLAQTAGVAMGIGAMSAVMLRLPLTSVLLPAVLLASTGPDTIPLVIVAVVVSFVVSAQFGSVPAPAEAPARSSPAPDTGIPLPEHLA